MRTAGIQLLDRCLVVGSGGSNYVKSCMLPFVALLRTLTKEANICTVDGRYSAAKIVIWESGSYFDELSNEFQNSPQTIRPSLMGLLNGTMSMSAINATLRLNSTAAASVKLPWNFTTTSQQ